MPQTVPAGGTQTFTVTSKNVGGNVVPNPGITPTLTDNSLGKATITPDGTSGVFTAPLGVSGTVNLSAQDSHGNVAPPQEIVVEDLVVTSIAITFP